MGVRKIKKWEIGDTFAMKIKSHNLNYNNKYLIINKVGTKKNDTGENDLVRIKLANNIEYNNLLESINNSEYIKPFFFWYEEWPNFINQKNLKKLDKFINKYKMIFIYIVELVSFSYKKTKKFYDDLIYLGNFSIKPPKNEFIPENFENISRIFLISENFQEDMINFYEWFNKKKSKVFDEKFSKKQNEIAKGAQILIDDYLSECEKISQKSNISNKNVADSLTFVGNDEITSKQKNNY